MSLSSCSRKSDFLRKGRECASLAFFMGYNDTIKQLRLRTRVQLRAALCGVFMLLLGASQEVTKKDAKTFPLGSPLSVPLYKDKDEKNRYSYPVSLATEPTRAAGEESKSVLA